MENMENKKQYPTPEDLPLRLTTEKAIEREGQRRKDFLEWAKETFHSRNIYYPGSGWDQLPKKIFGEDAVVHLSLEEIRGGYFRKLGSGHKVKGDFRESPFKDEAFDAVYICGTPPKITIGAVGEFYRILKNDGVLLFDNIGWYDQELEKFIQEMQKWFQKQQVPKRFDDPEDLTAHISEQLNENTWRELGFATSEKQIQERIKNIPQDRQRVARQFFAVFKKNGVNLTNHVKPK